MLFYFGIWYEDFICFSVWLWFTWYWKIIYNTFVETDSMTDISPPSRRADKPRQTVQMSQTNEKQSN